MFINRILIFIFAFFSFYFKDFILFKKFLKKESRSLFVYLNVSSRHEIEIKYEQDDIDDIEEKLKKNIVGDDNAEKRGGITRTQCKSHARARA